MSATVDPARDRRLVGALACTQIVSWGILYYAFGVLVAPMQAELDWSQGFLGAGFSLALLVSALLAVPVGSVLARRGARLVMTGGSCAGALLLVLWSEVERPASFLLVMGALGLPLASTLYEAAFTTVVARFGGGRRSDVSLLVLTIVGGLASTAFVPLTQGLVVEYGWRTALKGLALLLALGTIPLHALVLDDRPGRTAPVEEGVPPPSSKRLGLSAAAFALGTVAGTALGVYLVPHLLERGASARFAATAAAMIGVGQVLGRIGFTVLRPRHRLGTWAFVLFLPGAVGLTLLAWPLGNAFVIAAVLVFAAAAGAQTLGRTAWALELFPLAAFPRVNAELGRWALIGRAGAPFALGFVHDRCGSHGPGLLGLALACLAAAGLARAATRVA